MTRTPLTLGFALLSLTLACIGRAEDRLTFSANGSTLTDTNGGGGGSISWLHNFGPNALAGVAVEHQQLADARWQFGSLSGAYTGGAEGRKWSVYGEAHKGSGDDDAHDFSYQIAAVGTLLPLSPRLSLQLEDRQIDIDTTHGNLPKAGLSMSWSPKLQTAVAYAQSIGGNLGTKLGTVRFDYYEDVVHLIAGGAFGRADPAVVHLQPGLELPSRTLREGFLGAARIFPRSEILVLADYLELGDSERVTVTLSFTLHLNRPAAAQ